MVEASSVIDPILVNFILAAIGNLFTQIAKRIGADPRVVFGVVCFLVALVYVFFIQPFGDEFIQGLIAQFIQVAAIASGIWHWVLRPESDFQKFLKKKFK